MPWKPSRVASRECTSRPAFNSATAVMPWKLVADAAGQRHVTLQFGHGCDAVETPTPNCWPRAALPLQFGHGCDAVETGPQAVQVNGFEHLQFGHGCDAVETGGLGDARRAAAGPSIRPRL